MIDSQLEVAYHSYIGADPFRREGDRCGGVEWRNICSAPTLETVRLKIEEVLAGDVVLSGRKDVSLVSISFCMMSPCLDALLLYLELHIQYL